MLPIKLTSLPKKRGTRFTGDFKAISLTDWAQFLVDHDKWHVLLGLWKPNPAREKAILKEFWARFKVMEPGHGIWEEFSRHNVDTSVCCPLMFHGDEGRGRKRSAFLVCAYHSYLGFGTAAANSARKKREYCSMKLNYSTSTHITRMLTAVLPKMTQDDVAFKAIMDFVAKDCLRMLRDGVTSAHGSKFHFAVLSVTGDWMFLAKAGNLARSFANVPKRPLGPQSRPKGICHMCRAGQLGLAFEDCRRQPAWKATLFEATDEPFNQRPVLLQIPHDPAKPASLFKFDFWHAFHLGQGKSFTAAVLALLSDRMRSTSVDARFLELNEAFLEWCDESHTTPYLSGITKETIGWPDRSTYPNAMWNKGHVTTCMMKFLEAYLYKHRASFNDSPMLQMCYDACRIMNQAMEEMYRNDLWLPAGIANRIGLHGLQFVQLHGKLAKLAYDSNLALFIYMPKSHLVHHIFDECADAVDWHLNPLCHGVQISEDYIGKKSRLARKVHPCQAIRRVLERSLKAGYKYWNEAGLIEWWRKKGSYMCELGGNWMIIEEMGKHEKSLILKNLVFCIKPWLLIKNLQFLRLWVLLVYIYIYTVVI